MSKTFEVPGVWRQLIASIIVCIATFCCGLSYGWTATEVPHLQNKSNPLNIEPVTMDQVSWLGSSIPLSTLMILFFVGNICERFGRKATGLLLAVPFTLCWLLRLVATNFYFILASQMMSGAGEGFAFIFVPLYITEITDVNVRGFMASFVLFSFKIGLLVGYVLGTVLSYRVYAIVGLALPITYFGGVLLMPESPVWLVRHNRIAQAKKSLMWLKKNDKSVVEVELTRLQIFNDEMIEGKSSGRLKELFKDRAVVKGQVIGIILSMAPQIVGINIVVVYTVSIFEAAKSSIDPYIATIISGVMHVIGIGFSTVVIERIGRRPLLFASSIGVIICHISLGILFLLKSLDYDISTVGWLPMAAITIFAVAYSAGVGSMCYIVTNEVYHPDVASFCNSVSLFLQYFSAFMITKFFPALGDLIGLHYCFFILVVFCLTIFLLILFFVPETKGKTKETILNELRFRKGRNRGIAERTHDLDNQLIS